MLVYIWDLSLFILLPLYKTHIIKMYNPRDRLNVFWEIFHLKVPLQNEH